FPASDHRPIWRAWRQVRPDLPLSVIVSERNPMADEPEGSLPRDPDTEVEDGAARPGHLRPGYVVIVAAGGAAGASAREALALAFPAVNGIPYTILAINVVGALL